MIQDQRVAECCPLCGCFGTPVPSWHLSPFRLIGTSYALPTLVLLDDRRLSRGGPRMSHLGVSGPNEERWTAFRAPPHETTFCRSAERRPRRNLKENGARGRPPRAPRRRHSLSPGAAETRGPDGASRSPVGASRDEQQKCSLEDKRSEGLLPAPRSGALRGGVCKHPGSTCHPLPILRQPIKFPKMIGRSYVGDCAARTSKFTLPAM